MARRSNLLAALAVLLSAAVVLGEDPKPAASPDQKPRGKRGEEAPTGPRRPNAGPMSPEFQNARRALEALTPEQRQRFIENFKRWSNLPPEEKKVLADRESIRRKKIAEEVNQALAESGLDLTGERRMFFAKRYGEERRKIEEQLRKEMEEKRKPLIKEVIARLKEEFSTAPLAVPARSTPEP
jgi:hypothetical protein